MRNEKKRRRKKRKKKENSVDVLVMVRDRVVSDEESSPRYDAP